MKFNVEFIRNNERPDDEGYPLIVWKFTVTNDTNANRQVYSHDSHGGYSLNQLSQGITDARFDNAAQSLFDKEFTASYMTSDGMLHKKLFCYAWPLNVRSDSMNTLRIRITSRLKDIQKWIKVLEASETFIFETEVNRR